jgi:hypothetical protein
MDPRPTKEEVLYEAIVLRVLGPTSPMALILLTILRTVLVLAHPRPPRPARELVRLFTLTVPPVFAIAVLSVEIAVYISVDMEDSPEKYDVFVEIRELKLLIVEGNPSNTDPPTSDKEEIPSVQNVPPSPSVTRRLLLLMY